MKKADTSDAIIRFLASAVAYFLCLIAFYIDIGQDMGAKYFMPILLPVVTALFAAQFAADVNIFSRENLPNLVCALLWCSAFPLIYTWTYQTAWFMSLVSYDFIIGTCFLLFLFSSENIAMRLMNIKVAAALMTVFNFLLIIIPFVQYAYYVMVWHALSPASLMALYMTNWRESIDFLESNVGWWLLPVFAGLCALSFLAWRAHCRFGEKIRGKAWGEKFPVDLRGAVLAAICVLSVYIGVFCYIPECSVAGLWKDVTDYARETAEYGAHHDARFASLEVDAANAMPALSDKPVTVIMVIGESASRDYMKAFTPECPYDNTPWLTKNAGGNRDFLLFSNAYSSWSQTVPALQRALTEQSQYNGKDFLDSVSILDAAKKAGFTTHWYSNQGRYGQYDSVITLVAKTADYAEWTDDSYTFTDKYDIVLKNYLQNVDPTKNNFVVLHLIGSHIYYYNRYPYDFARWKTEDGSGSGTSAPSYANSILYTDYVLSQIFEYARDNLNLTAMVYFSDHGENLSISHNPDVFSFDMVRIPMFMYLSPAYRRLMPDEAYMLRISRDTYFTNDMMYDTICGMIGAKGNRYDSRQDLSSADYAFNREKLTTMLGQRRLIDDPKAK